MFRFAHSETFSDECEILDRIQIFRKRRFVREESEPISKGFGAGIHWFSEHRELADCRRNQAERHANRRRFSGTVCAEQPDGGTDGNAKRNISNSNVASLKNLGDVFELNRGITHDSEGNSSYELRVACREISLVPLVVSVSVARINCRNQLEIAVMTDFFKFILSFGRAHVVYAPGREGGNEREEKSGSRQRESALKRAAEIGFDGLRITTVVVCFESLEIFLRRGC